MTGLSTRLAVFYREYPGDVAWNKFVSNIPDIDSTIFSGYDLDNDIAKAIVWHAGSGYAVKWLTKKIPALDDYKPIDIMKLKEGVIILRTVLMRMP